MYLQKKNLLALLIIPQIVICQNDTIKYDWNKVIYEVFSTEFDSLNNEQYIRYKEPFFIAYFNHFSKIELDSIMHTYQILGNDPNIDSIDNPQYVAKVELCWVMMEMKTRTGLKQLNKYHDSFGDTIQLEFIKNGKFISIHNNFKIYYVLNTTNKKRIIEAQVSDNAFLAPDIGIDTVGKIMLEYENQFYDITLCDYRLQGLNKEIKLKLIFDTKPYQNDFLQIDTRGIRNELDRKQNMQGVFYVSADRLGLCKYDYFKKESKFFKKGKKIMK